MSEVLSPAQQAARVRGLAEELMRRAEQMYGVKLVGLTEQKFNITSARILGQAGVKGGLFARRYYLRWSPMCMAANLEQYMKDTVPHEVAHIVCYANPALGRKHDAGWRRVCIALGGNGSTRATAADKDATTVMRAELAKKRAARAVRRGGVIAYLYRTKSGEELQLSAIRHKKVMLRGAQYRSRRDGAVISKAEFVRPITG